MLLPRYSNDWNEFSHSPSSTSSCGFPTGTLLTRDFVVGWLVRDTVGDDVGILVGWLVGEAVGNNVGILVGCFVGNDVALEVRRAVGGIVVTS